MGSEWKQYRLGNIAEWSSGGTPSKANKDFWGGNIPWISASSMEGNRYNDSNLKVTELGLKSGTNLAPAESILLLVRGSILHQKIRVGITEKDVTFNQDVKALKVNKDILEPWYLLYWFMSKEQELLQLVENTGIGAGKLDTKILQDLIIDVPPLKERKVILSFIKAIEDRIGLNCQMNKTIEAMVQALFKSWFVDFDPVIDNALANGKEIPNALRARAELRMLNAEVKSNSSFHHLFPDEFVQSKNLGWIPKGWKVKSINQILKTVSEAYPLKSVEKVIFLNTGDILDGQFLHQNYSNVDSLPGQAKKSIMKDDILYSEIRPINRRFAYVHFDSQEYVVSTKLMVLRATSNIKSIFTYLILKQQSIIDYLQMMAESRSGTFPQITFDVLSTINVALPDNQTIIEYFTENIIERFFEKSITNNNNSKHLSNLRDTLLPKLLSGELRIPDAEKIIERGLD